MVVAEWVHFDQLEWDLEQEFELEDLELEFDLQGFEPNFDLQDPEPDSVLWDPVLDLWDLVPHPQIDLEHSRGKFTAFIYVCISCTAIHNCLSSGSLFLHNT